MLIWTLFTAEAYHSVAHFIVLTGWKLLPRKILVSVRYYFLLDLVCAALAYCMHRNTTMLPFLILQQWQHVFYFTTWDKSRLAKRVISWSSLDWDRGRWNQLDLVFGTAFDLLIHAANAASNYNKFTSFVFYAFMVEFQGSYERGQWWFLSEFLDSSQIYGAIALVIFLYFVVFNNPKIQPISYFDQLLVSKNN